MRLKKSDRIRRERWKEKKEEDKVKERNAELERKYGENWKIILRTIKEADNGK